MADLENVRQKAEKKRLVSMTRHVLVCVDDDCKGKSVDKRLRKAIGKAGLSTEVSTARVRCLGICRGGPIVVVYPDGTWYAGVDDKVVDRIVTEHLIGGHPVTEHLFMHNPMSGRTLDRPA